MVGVWGVWGPECFGVSQFPRGPAGQLGQEEVVEEKVQESFQARKVFQPEGGAAAPRAERGGCQGSARKGPETEPTAAVRPPQALLPE